MELRILKTTYWTSINILSPKYWTSANILVEVQYFQKYFRKYWIYQNFVEVQYFGHIIFVEVQYDMYIQNSKSQKY